MVVKRRRTKIGFGPKGNFQKEDFLWNGCEEKKTKNRLWSERQFSKRKKKGGEEQKSCAMGFSNLQQEEPWRP